MLSTTKSSPAIRRKRAQFHAEEMFRKSIWLSTNSRNHLPVMMTAMQTRIVSKKMTENKKLNTSANTSP